MKKNLRWLPAILVMAGIFILSSIPSKEMPSFGIWDTLVKKGGHMLGYGVLALSYWHALRWSRKYAWLAFVLAVVYALTDEFHQLFVAGRHASFLDALGFDAGGALLGLVVAALLRRRKAS